jgi:hypothetical protein
MEQWWHLHPTDQLIAAKCEHDFATGFSEGRFTSKFNKCIPATLVELRFKSETAADSGVSTFASGVGAAAEKT